MEVTLDNGSTTDLDVTWDGGTPAYDGDTPGTYNFEGTLTLPDGILNPEDLTAEVDVIVEEEIIPEDLHIAAEEDVVVDGVECFFALVSITVSGGDHHFTVTDGGEATLVAGETITLLPGSTVEHGGYLHAYISGENPCGRPLAEKEREEEEDVETGMQMPEPPEEGLYVNVYPNPTRGALTLEVQLLNHEERIRVEVLNHMGKMIYSREMPAQTHYSLDIANEKPGMYFVRIIQGNEMTLQRVIKQ